MDNFNNGNNDMSDDVTSMVDDIVNQDPAADLANQMNDDLGITSQETSNSDSTEGTGFKLAGDSSPNVEPQDQPYAPKFGQPMGGMNNQPQFGQPMGGMNNQPQFGQPMGGMNNQPQFGQPMGGMNNQPQFGQPQFGQPMGGMNHQPYGQPMGGMSQPPKKPKKPLSKGAIGGIIGGGVALIALIVCAIIFIPKLFPTDKEVVVDAFEATFGIETDAKTEDILGLDEISDKFATNGGHRETYVEYSETYEGETVTANATITEDIDVQNKLANTNATVAMDGTDIFSANMVVDENNTYFQVPELINGYFSLPNENIFQALENSPLGQAMELSGMPEYNMADVYFNLATTGSATELNGEYVAIVEKLWDSITYEKQGKAKIDVNGKTVTAKEYFVTLPEDSAKEAIGDLWDAVVAELAADPTYLAQMGMDAATFESTMNSYSSMLKGLISGDLVIKVYIVDDEIVKIVCADEVNIYGLALTYDMYIDIDDENASGVFDFSVMDESVGLKFNAENIDESPSGKITIYAAGEIIDVNFSSTVTESGSKENCDFVFDVVYNGTTYVECTSKVGVDSSNHSFDGDVVVSIMDAGDIEFTFAGGIKDIKKGEAYTVEITESKFSIDGVESGNFAAYVKVDASQHTAAGLDTSVPVYDVTTLSDTDFEDILEENASLIETWSENFYNALGIDYSYEEPTMEEPEFEEPDDGKTILTGTYKSVEILGTIPGFELGMDTDFFITYETDSMSYIEYVLYEDVTAQEVVEGIYVPSSDIINQEMGKTMEVDGETIYYSYVQDNEFGYNYSSYMFAKDLGDGTILVVDVGIYDEEDSFTKEQLAEAISSQYYKVVE